MNRGGLKKWVPSQWRRKSSSMPSARLVSDNPEVLELMMVPGVLKGATRLSRLRLISLFSATASMTQSQSLTQCR